MMAYLDSAATDYCGALDCPIEKEQPITNLSLIFLSNDKHILPSKIDALSNLSQISQQCKLA